MDATEEERFEHIDTLIHDENNIVTATNFSSSGRIKVCEAQNLLDKYAQSKDNISCTYILTGTTNNGICILLCKKYELEKKNALFKNIVSQHVYSIQKSDTDIIALANFEPFTKRMITEPLLGSVVSDKVVRIKLENVITNTLNKVKITKEEESKIKQHKATTDEITKPNTIIKNNAFNNTKPVINSKSKQKNMMTNFLSTPKVAETNGDSRTMVTGKSKQKNMMTNFFSKTQKVAESNVDTKAESTITVDPTDKIVITDTESESMEIDNNKSPSENHLQNTEDKPVKSNEPIAKSDEPCLTKQKKSKKRKTNSKNSQPSKKRKRIVETQDSDSDIFASSESEVEVVPDINLSDEDIPVENTPTQPSKTRKMKQITEEFMDEDGYINTVQKFVMLSDDDEENQQKSPNIVEKNEKPIKPKEVANKNEKSSPKKSTKNAKLKATKVLQNQASIMDFFKKS